MNIRVSEAKSVTLISIPGHIPSAYNPIEATESIISRLVTGSANRLVIKKYRGNVRKWNQAAGAVNSWQETARAIAFHIFLTGYALPLSSPGYQAFSRGSRMMIPAIAR